MKIGSMQKLCKFNPQIDYAALRGRMRFTSLWIALLAFHRSTARCAFSQNSGLLPKSRASRNAISGLIDRRSRKSSLMDWRDTPIAFAKPETESSKSGK